MDLTNLLEVKVTKEPLSEGVRTQLSKEEFRTLQKEIDFLKEKLAKGEQITVNEAAKITVWFRARRAEAFTVQQAVKAKQAVKTKAKVPARRKKPSRQELGDALIAKL